MALDLTPEQMEQGRQNFAHATGDLTRRGFMKSMVAAGAVAAAGVDHIVPTRRGPVKQHRPRLEGVGDLPVVIELDRRDQGGRGGPRQRWAAKLTVASPAASR